MNNLINNFLLILRISLQNKYDFFLKKCVTKVIPIKIDELHLKCDFVDGSISNGTREPNFFSNASDKHGFIIYFEPVAILSDKLNKFVLVALKFYSEEDDRNKDDCSSETRTQLHCENLYKVKELS